MIVELEQRERAIAAHVGLLRYLTVLHRGYRQTHGQNNGDGLVWDRHIEGAGAELAVAKALGRYWTGAAVTMPDWLAGAEAEADVGGLQVRHTQRDDGCLIVNLDDEPAATFVLVTGRMPTYVLRGWLEGALAPARGTLRGRAPGAYFVPQSELEALESLELELAAAG